MVYGGSFLASFSMFMLSFSKPNQVYQVKPTSNSISQSHLNLKVFLAQGIGFGLGAGLTYLPSIVIVSEYFKIKAPRVMMIVAAGCSIGAVVHPIVLNLLLTKVGFGFASSVRASAGFMSAGLALACALIRSPKSKKRKAHRAAGKIQSPQSEGGLSMWTVVIRSVRDVPFAIYCIA